MTINTGKERIKKQTERNRKSSDLDWEEDLIYWRFLQASDSKSSRRFYFCSFFSLVSSFFLYLFLFVATNYNKLLNMPHDFVVIVVVEVAPSLSTFKLQLCSCCRCSLYPVPIVKWSQWGILKRYLTRCAILGYRVLVSVVFPRSSINWQFILANCRVSP